MKSMATNMAIAPAICKPSVTGKPERHFSPQVISTESICEVLKKITTGENAIITPKEIADIFQKNISTVSKYLLGQVNMTIGQVFTLVHETANRGDFSLTDIIIPKQYFLEPCEDFELDGSLDGEIGELTQQIGGARENFNNGKINKAACQIHNAKKYVAQMEREIKARRVA